MPEAADSQLLLAAQTDPEAFAAFYRRHARGVLAFFRARTPAIEVAFDLTAETFAAALESVSRFVPGRDGNAGVAWLYGIARNKLREALRRGQVDDETRSRLLMQRVELTDAGLEKLERDAADDALRALEHLPADQAAAIRARLLEEEEYSAIAERLACSELVVRQRVSRGLRALRTTLKERLDDA